MPDPGVQSLNGVASALMNGQSTANPGVQSANNGVINGVSARTYSRANGQLPETSSARLESAGLHDVNGVNDDDPVICIVGMACRLPGGVRSPSELWDFLSKKKSAQGPVPVERFNIKAFYHPDSNRAGTMNADGGYFLREDVRQFENHFFGINNLEATYMDPQQRKLLEVVFECFEGAGLSMDSVAGANIGVYVGNFTVDYQMMQARDVDYLHRYGATGSGTAIMANRISHVFNLHGPSFVLDTACSSSIYCLHNAVNAIQSGECDGAIVAGANLITSPEQHIGTAKSGVLSPTSTCHTFDASADGYGRGEAVSAVYLKRLSAAKRDDDKIWAVIRGTAINANGKTPGITQPSSKFQEEVIRKAYSKARLSFDDTDYIECHGTGTAVGDPIEVSGLQNCFGPRDHPLMIGSVKTNLGHSEAASGLTSLIKVALAFHNSRIPPSYGVVKLSPKLNLERANMSVPTDVEVWPRATKRASINSFGYGGANAHCILESIDSYLRKPSTSSGRPTIFFDQLMVVPVSAASQRSLDTRVAQVTQAIQRCRGQELESLVYTMTDRRPSLQLRTYVLTRARSDHASDIIKPEPIHPVIQSSMRIRFAFVFTGQGAQYAGMGRELLDSSKTFADTIENLDNILKSLPAETSPNWTLKQTLLDAPEVSLINDPIRSQPICTAVQVALVEMLRTWNVVPSAAIGHSSGEIGAAYAAQLISAKEALLAAYFRGLAVSRLTSQGAMVTAKMSPEAAAALIEDHQLQGRICVACVNSPESVTFSGELEAVDIVISELQKGKVFARRLETGGRPYHSHLIREIGDLYETLLTPHLAPESESTTEKITMFSSVGPHKRNTILDMHQAKSASYWRSNLERPVQFAAALEDLIGADAYHLLEIGPHPALKGPIQQIQKATGRKQFLPYSPSLVRNEDAEMSMKKLAGTLYSFGHSLDWKHVNMIAPQNKVVDCSLAPYPWDYSAGLLWVEPRPSIELRNRNYLRHELLGTLQTAGSGIDHMWRNILQLEEIPWLAEHMVESQVVFPAVAYLAMAMEAITQARRLKDPTTGKYAHQDTTFEMRNVSFGAALVIQQRAGPGVSETELHTRLSARKLSTTTASTDWCEFEISSWEGGRAVLHCAGQVRTTAAIGKDGVTVIRDTVGFETQNMDRWYEKLANEGIVFGPNFRALTSLSTDSTRYRSDAIATTKLRTRVGKVTDTTYPIHPVIIDGVMQCGVMGGTGGDVNILNVHLPVFLSECRVQVASPSRIIAGERDTEEDAVINSTCCRTNVSTVRINSTLQDQRGVPLVDIKDLRLSMYTGKVKETLSDALESQRHPTLRIAWKPDILRVFSADRAQDQLMSYIRHYLRGQTADHSDNETLGTMGTLVDLLGHCKPRMRILEIETGCHCRSSLWQSLVDMNTALPRCLSWHCAGLDDNGELRAVEGTLSNAYDGVIIYTRSNSDKIWKQSPEKVLSLLDEYGFIMTRGSAAAKDAFSQLRLQTMDVSGDIILARRPIKSRPLEGTDVIIISKEPSSRVQALAEIVSDYLERVAGSHSVQHVALIDIEKAAISPKTVCISLLEVEVEFLATVSPQDMNLLRRVTDVTTNLLWLTGAGMLHSRPNPNLTLSNGLSRALMLEQPALRWAILDIGPTEEEVNLYNDATCHNIVQALTIYENIDDREFIQLGGLLYSSRFVPAPAINELFRRRVGEQEPLAKSSLSSVGEGRLIVGRPGTLHFQQTREPTGDHMPPPVGFIDVAIKAASLGADNVAAINGQAETRANTICSAFAGVVLAVAPNDDGVAGRLAPGDHVVVMAPNNLHVLSERVPAWAVHKMLPDEKFDVLCAVPVAWTTALFALRNRGGLRAGESVLIHGGAGSVGRAAVALALQMGATVYATMTSQAERDCFVSELGVPSSNVFSATDHEFVERLKLATRGRGVDLVLNTLAGDLMHASWECLASFGRFVEIGRREIKDAGRLEMHNFSRNTTFTSFDMLDLFYHEDPHYRDLWLSLTTEVLNLYRSGRIDIGKVSKFDIADVCRALEHCGTKDSIDSVVLTFDKPDSQIQVAPSKYTTILDPEKVYLMIGCLGGLGRSLSRWMMARGARNFVFLGRSGCDKPAARDLVGRLESNGANATVVRGDVSNYDDVVAAVRACIKPIGGVIQAAMGLHEALFSTMTNEAWHTGIRPKWKGTWNLDHALEGREEALDFFLLTSSVSGSVATATESNYCAANGFLDAFARWRRSQGKKAVSIGFGMIAEVGYLHENSEIGALLLRKGLQALSEEEFLQVTDLALSGPGGDMTAWGASHNAGPDTAHLLTGLEPMGLRKLIAQGWDVSSGNMQDPRTSVLSASLMSDRQQAGGDGSSSGGQTAVMAGMPEWLRGVSKAVAASFASETTAASLVDAVLSITRKRFSSMILTQLDQIDNQKPLAQFGMDSMIGAEFRTWIWGTFKVDIPFLDLLSNQKALFHIAENITSKLEEGAE